MRTVHQQSLLVLPFAETDFGSYDAPPDPPSGHVHDAIEISAFEGGSVTMLYGGREITVPPDRLIVHWGMLPHQALQRDSTARVVGIHLPLSWFLQWELPGSLLERILNLEIMIEPPQTDPCSDLALLKNWRRILEAYGQDAVPIVLAESRARLLRIVLLSDTNRGVASLAADHPPVFGFFRAMEMIARCFREPLQIAEVAAHARISPRHLTRVFHEHTGQTMNEYLTRLRLSHAQRLLVTTHRTVTDIMYDAGFSCSTHFYKVFRNQTGQTPAKYRARQVINCKTVSSAKPSPPNAHSLR